MVQFDKLTKAVSRDESGNVGIIFALAMVPCIMLAGVAVDYARMKKLNSGLQSASDAASLAAVKALASGQAATDVQALAETVFKVNAEVNKIDGTALPTPTVTQSMSNGIATVTVAFDTTIQGAFTRIMNKPTLPVSGTATATAGASKSLAKGKYSGMGYVWGDPHVEGADGKAFYVGCPKGNWYDLLSDSHFEINVTCQPWASSTADVVTAFSVLVGGHTYVLTYPQQAINSVGWGQWTGYDPVLTIDGVTQSTPTSVATLANSDATIQFGRMPVDDVYQGIQANLVALHVVTPTYDVQMYFPYGGYIAITASGAGTCSPPGGVWGKTLAGIDDTNTSDFLVSGAGGTAPEFNQPRCALPATTPRLIN